MTPINIDPPLATLSALAAQAAPGLFQSSDTAAILAELERQLKAHFPDAHVDPDEKEWDEITFYDVFLAKPYLAADYALSVDILKPVDQVEHEDECNRQAYLDLLQEYPNGYAAELRERWYETDQIDGHTYLDDSGIEESTLAVAGSVEHVVHYLRYFNHDGADVITELDRLRAENANLEALLTRQADALAQAQRERDEYQRKASQVAVERDLARRERDDYKSKLNELGYFG